MYKGVVTVAVATFVASVAIIATNANTKDATEDEAKVKQQNAVSTTVVDGAKNTSDTAGKVATTATEVVGSETNKAKKEVTSEETEAKKASDVPPPPSPFVEGKDKKVDEVASRPVAPAKPVVMKAPKAPVAPEVKAASSDVATEMKKDEASESAIKAPKAPMADIAVPKKPVIVETTTSESSQIAPKVDAKIEVATDPSKAIEASTKKLVATEAKVDTPADIKATSVTTSKVSTEAVKLKAPEAPVEIKSPVKPEVIELKVPEAPKGYLPKPIEIPQNKEASTKKQSTQQQPMQMMLPQGMKMPQGMPPQMMMPPQGMKMPQGIPPQMMMPPQMINGQGIMMVPVYPMNMGRPIYPYGYQMPFPNAMPQRNFQQRPIVKPNWQQAPAEKAEK